MNSKITKVLWFGVSTLLLLGLIYLADVSLFLEALGRANLFYLLPALIFGILPLSIYSFTWYRFLNKMGENISYFRSLRMFLGGQFLNAITPIGQFGGEPFMAYVIKENTGLEYEEAFSTVLSADLVNSVPIITFLSGGVVYMLFLRGVNGLLTQFLFAALLMILVGSSLAYLLWFRSGTIENAILRILGILVGILGRGEKIYQGLEKRFEGVEKAFETIGEDPKHLVVTAVVVHLEFIFRVIALYLVLFSLGVKTDFAPLYFVLAFGSVASFAPTPGGSGVAEAAHSGLISFFLNLSLATAAAAAILLRLMIYWPSIVIGYLGLLSLRGDD